MKDTVEVAIAGGDARRVAELPVQRLYNLGSATRDPERAQAHQTEMADAGVPIALDVPAPRIYPIAPGSLTTGREVFVHGPRTSGEVEIVVAEVEDLLYIGVGSDHTDRDLEQTSILWSKQVCPNVMASEFWRWSDVADHWDELELEMDLDDEPYQRFSVAMFLKPSRMIEIVRDRTDAPTVGLWVFGGTGASINRRLGYGQRWSFRLIDPRLGRQLEHSYKVSNLLEEVEVAYRVPLFRQR